MNRRLHSLWRVLLVCLPLCCVVSQVTETRAGGGQSQAKGRVQLQRLVEKEGMVQIGLEVRSGSGRVRSAGSFRLGNEVGSTLECVAGEQATIRLTGGQVEVFAAGRRLSGSRIVVESPAGDLEWNGRTYKGRLLLRPARDGVQVINEIFIEDYLAGVLAAEIGQAPIEALKAQAVVARSEVVHKLLLDRHKSEGFDLCAGEHCMAYKGSGGVTSDMLRACSETRGIVLVADGEILDAVFHTMCGGITAGAEDVWDSPPIAGLQPVWDRLAAREAPMFESEQAFELFLEAPPPGTLCAPTSGSFPSYARKYYRWTKRYDAETLSRMAGVGIVRDIVILERRPSGRVRRLAIEGTRQRRIIEKELPIRRLFDLPSGLFMVRVEKEGDLVRWVEFIGAGSGHGVGLCQMGAWTMAERGARFDAILAHYYPRARLERIYK